MTQNCQRDNAVFFGEIYAAHAHRIAAFEHPHFINFKANTLALRCGQQHVIRLGAKLHVDNALALIELHCNFTGAVDCGKV